MVGGHIRWRIWYVSYASPSAMMAWTMLDGKHGQHGSLGQAAHCLPDDPKRQTALLFAPGDKDARPPVAHGMECEPKGQKDWEPVDAQHDACLLYSHCRDPSPSEFGLGAIFAANGVFVDEGTLVGV